MIMRCIMLSSIPSSLSLSSSSSSSSSSAAAAASYMLSMLRSMSSTSSSHQKTKFSRRTYLDHFLKKYRAKKGDISTHTSMGGIKGSYCIPDTKMKEFFMLYNYALFDHKVPLHLTERHRHVGPVVIDIDLRFKLKDCDGDGDGDDAANTYNVPKQYDKSFVEKIVSYNTMWLSKIFTFKDASVGCRAFVFERKSPYIDKGVVKDGLHIVYPHVITEPWAQHMLRLHTISKCESEELDSLPGLVCRDWKEIIDEGVIQSVGWTLYGSTKPGRLPYDLAHVYDNNMESLDLGKVINSYGGERIFPQLLSIRNKPDHSKWVNDNVKMELKERYDNLFNRKKPVKENVKSNGGVRAVEKLPRADDLCLKPFSDEDIEEIKNLVSRLNVRRAKSYREWINVGLCLHNISNCEADEDKMLQIWKDFSAQDIENYDEDDCDERWLAMSFNNTGLKQGSLRYWALEDSAQDSSNSSKERI